MSFIFCLFIFSLFYGTECFIAPKWSRNRSQRISKNVLRVETPADRTDSWQELEWFEENYNDEKSGNIGLPPINPAITLQLEKLVDKLISCQTVKTASYYMLEFKNDLEHQWLMNFEQCKSDGFNTYTFDTFIDKMITMDKFEVYYSVIYHWDYHLTDMSRCWLL